MHSKTKRRTQLLNFKFQIIYFFLLATFDARDTVMFFNFPSISEFTMCFWIKVDESWTGENPNALYYRQQDTQVMIVLYIASGEIRFGFVVTPQFQQDHEIHW